MANKFYPRFSDGLTNTYFSHRTKQELPTPNNVNKHSRSETPRSSLDSLPKTLAITHFISHKLNYSN